MILKYRRSKQSGVPKTYEIHITGDREVGIIKRYMALFNEDDEGALLRKLVYRGSMIKATKSPIGKNTIPAAGKHCAIYIGKENPQLFTGHCWRRASATLLSEKGISLAEIKLVTGIKI
ncbi:MAG: hypothetical protein NTU90_01910 [Proteobacteria bacterium]|nr:hypothetical protein [Pseudomonadota bacterium]